MCFFYAQNAHKKRLGKNFTIIGNTGDNKKERNTKNYVKAIKNI